MGLESRLKIFDGGISEGSVQTYFWYTGLTCLYVFMLEDILLICPHHKNIRRYST